MQSLNAVYTIPKVKIKQQIKHGKKLFIIVKFFQFLNVTGFILIRRATIFEW